MHMESMLGLMFTLICGAAVFIPASIVLALLQARKPAAGGQRLVLLLVLPVLLGFAAAFAITRLWCSGTRCIERFGSGYYGGIPICGASFALAFALTAIAGYALAQKAGRKAAFMAPLGLCLSVVVIGIVLGLSNAGYALARWQQERNVANRTLNAGRFDCGAVQEIPAEECQALVSIYLSTNGADWNTWVDKGQWLESRTPCSWFHVTCENGHVTGITVGAVSGSLPPEIRDLPYLSTLVLGGEGGGLAGPGGLTGPIPPELGDLSQLEKLSLVGNKLGGAIPPQLGRLERLRYLDLFDNQLSGSIPSELGNLRGLTVLDLRANQLTGAIPPELSNLKGLTELGLGWGNQLTGTIPIWLADLTALEKLSLGTPTSGEEERRGNFRGSIPVELERLDCLVELDLEGNQLTGPIPAELSQLQRLQTLNLSHNQLSGEIPAELGELTALQRLNLGRNPLSGPLPRSLMNLPLESFWFEDTSLCESGDAEFQGWKGKVGATGLWFGTRIIRDE
jgi:hypothetical protein